MEGVAARLRQVLLENGRDAFGDKQGEKEVRFTFAVNELDEKIAMFVSDRTSKLWAGARQLAGADELCVLMDRGFSKDPGDPETHWHRDDEAIGLPAAHPLLRTVHAWLPLTAMQRNMGTLRYLAGTHRRQFGWFENLLASLWGWEFAWFATAPVTQDDDLEVGDVAWHDGWVLHSAGAHEAGAGTRDGMAVSFAYCASPGRCGGLLDRVSQADATCKVAARLFDEKWRAKHRDGETDYAKTLLKEPLGKQVTRFTLRTVAGALGGIAIHWLATSCWRNKPKSA